MKITKTNAIVMVKKLKLKKQKEEGGDFLHFNNPDGIELHIIQTK